MNGLHNQKALKIRRELRDQIVSNLLFHGENIWQIS